MDTCICVILFLVSFCAVIPLFSQVYYDNDVSHSSDKTVQLLTLPRDDGNVLYRVIVLMKLLDVSNKIKSDADYDYESNQEIHLLHQTINTQTNRLFSDTNCMLRIVLIRDPRDALLAQIDSIQKYQCWSDVSLPQGYKLKFKIVPFYVQFMSVLRFEKRHLGIPYVYEQVLSWAKDTNTLICKYEDLFSEDEGVQDKIVRSIANGIGLEALSTNDYRYIIQKLNSGFFGNPSMGKWKTTLTPIQKKLCKLKLSKMLNGLGYE